MDNKELVEKGLITAQAIAAAGKLNPEQANAFIDYVFDLSTLKNSVRTVRFKPEQMEIDKIGVGKRVAVPAEEGKDPGVRRGITTSKVVLEPKKIMVPFEISKDFMQYNIEGESVEDHIMRMFALQTGNDLEELALLGDKLGYAVAEGDIVEGGESTKYVKDSYLALCDGWLRSGDSGHVYDAANANITPAVLSAALNALPEKFKRNKLNMRFITSSSLEQNYRQQISTRATNAGDTALQSSGPVNAFGVPVMPASLFPFQPPVVEHITLTGPGTPDPLRYKPISTGAVVTLATLGSVPVTPYVPTTNYLINTTNGTIEDVNIGPGTVVKVTYRPKAQLLLTEMRNLIWAIGEDISVDSDKDIFKGMLQFALTVKMSAAVEEVDALVKVINVGLG